MTVPKYNAVGTSDYDLETWQYPTSCIQSGYVNRYTNTSQSLEPQTSHCMQVAQVGWPHPSLRQSVNSTAVTTVSFQIRAYSLSCRSLLLHLTYFLGIAIFAIPFISARSMLNSNVIKLAEVHWVPKTQYRTAQCCRGLLSKATKALVCGTVNFRVHKYEGNSISMLQIVIEKNRMEIMTYKKHLFFNIISIQI